MKNALFKKKRLSIICLIAMFFIGFVSSVIFSSAIVSQTASFFNYSVSKQDLFANSSQKLIFTVNNKNNYYEKNRDYLWRDKTPTLYKSDDILVEGYQLCGFESFPLHFFNEEKVQKRYLAQYIVLNEGTSDTFNEDFSSIISLSLYKKIFGRDADYTTKSLNIEKGGKTISTRICALFDFEPTSNSTNNKLYTDIYGEDYCFVNTNVANELNFRSFSVLMDTTNYFKYFPYYLFNNIDYDDIQILSYYSTFSEYLDGLVKYNNNTRMTRVIISSFMISISLFLSSFIVFKYHRDLDFIKKHLYFWGILSLIFITSNLLGLLFMLINKSFIIFTMGLGINFVFYVIFGLFISFEYYYFGNKKND